MIIEAHGGNGTIEGLRSLLAMRERREAFVTVVEIMGETGMRW